MTNFLWKCPFCNRDTTITWSNYSEDDVVFDKDNKYGPFVMKLQFTVCPNEQCRELSLKAGLYKAIYEGRYKPKDLIQEWNLVPQSRCRVFPGYIPQQLREDYNEACAILNFSPKASATLSRRCLQGMIRDFWNIIDKRTLKQEIDAIQDRIEPEVWDAIEAVRKVGNIGAHMDKDVDLIVNVEPGEAEQLIELIEMLFDEWYINKHERKQRLLKIKQIPENKASQKSVV